MIFLLQTSRKRWVPYFPIQTQSMALNPAQWFQCFTKPVITVSSPSTRRSAFPLSCHQWTYGKLERCRRKSDTGPYNRKPKTGVESRPEHHRPYDGWTTCSPVLAHHNYKMAEMESQDTRVEQYSARDLSQTLRENGRDEFKTRNRLTETRLRHDNPATATCNDGLTEQEILCSATPELSKWRIVRVTTAKKIAERHICERSEMNSNSLRSDDQVRN